jgi:hypothetical protein
VHCWHGVPRAALRLSGAVSGPVGASQSNAPFEGASSCHPLCAGCSPRLTLWVYGPARTP